MEINLDSLNYSLLHKKNLTISTILTLMRIVMTPVIVGAMVYGWWGSAFFLFIIASITDVLDGAVARLLNEQSFFGACLDPIADKFLIISCFATLAYITTPLFSIPQWFLWLVLGKELVLVGGAVVLCCVQGSVKINPSYLGKATMCAQVLFIVWLFACYFFNWMPIKTYYTMLGVVGVLEIACLLQYGFMGITQCTLSQQS